MVGALATQAFVGGFGGTTSAYPLGLDISADRLSFYSCERDHLAATFRNRKRVTHWFTFAEKLGLQTSTKLS